MAREGFIDTGELLPRNYGIGIIPTLNYPNLLMTPLNYLNSYFKLKDENITDSEKFLKKVKKLGKKYVGSVPSDTFEDFEYDIFFEMSSKSFLDFANTHQNCECDDFKWSQSKVTLNACKHLSLVHVGMYMDEKERMSTMDSYTSLKPKDRIKPFIPFLRGMRKKDFNQIEELIDVLSQEKLSQFEINKNLLLNPEIYSPELIRAIQDPNDYVQFRALVQKEKERKLGTKSLTESDRRYYSSVKGIESKLIKLLLNSKYHYDGHVLEFKDTDNEVIAQRFRNGNTTYSICIPETSPPYLVRKHLLDKIENIFDFELDDYSKDNVNPINITQEYESIDDATRKYASTKIIIPGEKGDSSRIKVPKIIKDRYDKIRI